MREINMREIKFKILKIDLHSFLYDEGRTILDIGIEDLEAIRHNPKNYLFIQYTGLKDKKNREIYEGDIINLVNDAGKSINVICEFGTAKREIFENTVDITGFYFKLSNGKKTFPIVNNYCGKHDLELFEIIGNIYEHPEKENKNEMS